MPILNALSDKKTSFTISTSTLRRYQFHQKMTERAPNKLYTTKFVQTQFVVPEKNIHRFFEAFLTVFKVHAKFIRGTISKIIALAK